MRSQWSIEFSLPGNWFVPQAITLQSQLERWLEARGHTMWEVLPPKWSGSCFEVCLQQRSEANVTEKHSMPVVESLAAWRKSLEVQTPLEVTVHQRIKASV